LTGKRRRGTLKQDSEGKKGKRIAGERKRGGKRGVRERKGWKSSLLLRRKKGIFIKEDWGGLN